MRAFAIVLVSVLIAVGIGLGFLAATGTTSTGAGGDAALLTAFEHAANASSEHVSMSVVEHISGYGDEAITMVGDEAKVDGSAEGAFEMSVGGKKLEERLTPSGTYVDFGSQLPGGATWMEITTSGLSKVLGVKDATSLFSSQGDPSQLLGLLAASSPAGITNLGATSIDAAETTEYRASVDLSSIAEREGASYEQLLKRYRKFITRGTLPVTVWIDSSGLPRRIATEVPERLTIQGTVVSVDVAMTLDTSNFGEPVTVAPPPASQVYVVPDSQLKSLANLAGGAS